MDESKIIKVIHESHDVRIAENGVDSERTIFIFSGIHGAYDFRDTLSGIHCRKVWITDKVRSWYNAPGLAETIDRHLAAFDPSRSVCIGVSLGGFGAVLFGARLKVRRVVAFSPQIVVDSARLGQHDQRWGENTDPYAPLPFPDIVDALRTPGPEFYVLMGLNDVDDLYQRGFIPPESSESVTFFDWEGRYWRDRLDRVKTLSKPIRCLDFMGRRFQLFTHDVVTPLKKYGVLRDMVTELLRMDEV